MSLRDCQLAYEHRSGSTNIVDNFYIPCLSQSVQYWSLVDNKKGDSGSAT